MLPVYNHAGLVGEAIAGVLSQTYTNWELIIVDDGSTDDLADRVRPFVDDRRVLFLRQPNQKLPAALNFGFMRARGEFFTWTSADNVMLPNQLEVLVAEINAHPRAGVVYSDYQVIDDRGEPLNNALWRPHNRDPNAPDLIRLPDTVTIENFHSRHDNFIGASFLYRREIAEAVGRYSDHAFGAEDYDFWLRADLVTEFHHVATPLYKYRVHDDCLSAKLEELNFFSTIHEVRQADRWRIENYLVGGLRPCGGASFWRPPEQFRSDLLALCRPLDYATLVKRSPGDPAEQPIVLDLDAAECDLDPSVLQRAHILLCRSATIARLLRQESWTYAKRILTWGGEMTAAIQHAFIQTLGDKDTTPMPDPIRTRAKIDKLCYPKRVLVLVDHWQSCGVGEVVVALAKGLARRLRVVVVAAAHGEAPPASLFGGLPVRSVSFDGSEAAYETFLRDSAIEVVNYHGTRFGAEQANREVVANVYTMYESCLRMDEPAQRQAAIELAVMDGIIAVSRRVGLFVETQLGYPGEKITIVPNAPPRACLADPDEPVRSDALTQTSSLSEGIMDYLLAYTLGWRGGVQTRAC